MRRFRDDAGRRKSFLEGHFPIRQDLSTAATRWPAVGRGRPHENVWTGEQGVSYPRVGLAKIDVLLLESEVGQKNVSATRGESATQDIWVGSNPSRVTGALQDEQRGHVADLLRFGQHRIIQ